jgi:integrase/recombinase XerD
MTDVHWEHYPLVTQMPRTQAWLQMQANFGLAPNTVAAYGRALNDYLTFCQHHEFGVESATKEQIAQYVHDLASRPNPRGSAIRVLDSGTGLANATLQQRLTVVRLFYDYLVEEGYREINPVGRGRYTVGKGFGESVKKDSSPATPSFPGFPTMTNGKRSCAWPARRPFGIG